MMHTGMRATTDAAGWHRVRPRFYDQAGHETIYASRGNKHNHVIIRLTKIMNNILKHLKFIPSKCFFVLKIG